MRIAFFFLFATLSFAQQRRPLVVVSVDGMDHRYLRDAGRLGLRIPNLRRITGQGEWADGVTGVFPTVTWPSHTTIITGAHPFQHGIEGNRRPRNQGGDYYWTVDLLKVKTLWHAAHDAGLKSAAITWPVTVDASIDYNLPEYFRRRNGGGMDLESIAEKGTPGLAAEIARLFPAFPHEWMDDRSRTLATIFLLKQKKPDLILLHLVDHDSEAHERGPFTPDANGILEYTDQLIGQILAAMPPDGVLALVSDHGFERVDQTLHIPALLQQEGVHADVQITPMLLLAKDTASAEAIRKLTGKGIGREVPKAEIEKYAPKFASFAAAFEPAEHTTFGSGAGTPLEKHAPRGEHGYWPLRHDYRSTFALYGNGIAAKKLPEMQMTEIAGRLAAILGVTLP